MLQAMFTRFVIVHLSHFVSSPLDITATFFEVLPALFSVCWSVIVEVAKRSRLSAMRLFVLVYLKFVAWVFLGGWA